ncbi:hypothetical protein C8J47_0183 [Sphingomonas sp. PP-F2F-G114-C0414]|jgi:hypothetical protein|nr:hypothetical protein C8J47_0183 [Sphingomonas sp. PP-F2F-G114-C0414]
MTALICSTSRKREGAGGWARAFLQRNASGERVPTPNPSRMREGGK